MTTEPVVYYNCFLLPNEAEELYDEMLRLDWERRPDAPRHEYWVNDFFRSYTYGKGAGTRTYNARPFSRGIRHVRQLILDLTGVYHEGCFLNRYEGARDWLGWHSDDDAGIDHEDPISVVTLGSPRELQYCPIDTETKKPRKDLAKGVMLRPGSLLVMRPGMQQTHYHRIPKVGHETGRRISMTFRSLRQPTQTEVEQKTWRA